MSGGANNPYLTYLKDGFRSRFCTYIVNTKFQYNKKHPPLISESLLVIRRYILKLDQN